MNIICQISIAAFVSYLIGAVPCGLLIGLSKGIDIRKVGSGNIGATNVTRSVSPIAGKICFFCDFLKGMLPTLLVQYIIKGAPIAAIICGMAAVLGHMFPVYLKFKGGKGISTAAGVAIALAPLPLLTALAIWGAVFFAFRYVSLASIIAATMLPVSAFVYAYFNVGGSVAKSKQTLIFFIIIAVLAVVKHTSNIKRLLNGTESRFEKKGSVPDKGR
ncbi:MAG: glycerol-3-phosphate 1-O-acyltransferase PlsY [Lentisphaeria bacterium]|jgi:glycerol-3-phosphate acyltransferase PlsY|nr:glycerol-3-phosphate 1-O-acyltransferase PlsY [Lentisphaeria bacterium]